ncbi:MAG: small multi-drug export protein [archaeon]|nr:small multi-drug export protein [archaeon]MCR4324000.1 small multi-drug export protein [Nanoarchaeota archaeon]
MNPSLFLGLLFSVLPVIEIRGGIPLIVNYGIRHGIHIWPYIILALILNILIVPIIFILLDFFHKLLVDSRFYKHLKGRASLRRVIGKARKIGPLEGFKKYVALFLLVAIPLPGTGVWTGALIAWIIDADRKKSLIAIAFGVIVSGMIVLAASTGLLRFIY